MNKVIDDNVLIQAIKDWNSNKRMMDKLKEENRKIEDYVLEHFSAVDLTSDEKGTETLTSADGNFRFVINHKVDVKVDMEQAKVMLDATGKAPEYFFNVKYDYSATINKMLDEENKQWLAGCLTYKRAKSQFKAEILEG